MPSKESLSVCVRRSMLLFSHRDLGTEQKSRAQHPSWDALNNNNNNDDDNNNNNNNNDDDDDDDKVRS